jgi:hypothetical protein
MDVDSARALIECVADDMETLNATLQELRDQGADLALYVVPVGESGEPVIGVRLGFTADDGETQHMMIVPKGLSKVPSATDWPSTEDSGTMQDDQPPPISFEQVEAEMEFLGEREDVPATLPLHEFAAANERNVRRVWLKTWRLQYRVMVMERHWTVPAPTTMWEG